MLTEQQINNLKELGASDFIINQINTNNLIPARIVSQHSGFYYAAISPKQSILSFLSGKLKHKLKSKEELPVSGDWVLLENKNADKLPIVKILNRYSKLMRKLSEKNYYQILAANIDLIFIVNSADKSFSLSRLSKYIHIADTSDIPYKVIINKMDLLSDPDLIEQIKKNTHLTDSDIIPLDSVNMRGYDKLKEYLIPQKTSVFIGPSGAGKSTIINNLYGEKILKTQEVREKDFKGRHTTTLRKLIILKNGHLIIDTPGIRIIEADGSFIFSEKFKKIHEYARNCKFNDCTHTTEKECAVKDAVSKGEIDIKLYNEYINYLKML